MTFYTVLSVALGGFTGSILRYKLGSFIMRKTGNTFPTGTIIINISGSFFLGSIVALNIIPGINQYLYLFLTTGFAGAFTTFSTAMYELYKLMEDRQNKEAFFYFIYTFAGGISASILGYWAVKLLIL